MPNYKNQIEELNKEVVVLKGRLDTTLAILTHNIGGLANTWISHFIIADVVTYLKYNILIFPLSESTRLSNTINSIQFSVQLKQKNKDDEQTLKDAIAAFKNALNVLRGHLEIAETIIFVCLIHDYKLEYKKETHIKEFKKQFQEFCRLFDPTAAPETVKAAGKHEEIKSQRIEADNANKTYIELRRFIQQKNDALAEITSNIKTSYSEEKNDDTHNKSTSKSITGEEEGRYGLFKNVRPDELAIFQKLLGEAKAIPEGCALAIAEGRGDCWFDAVASAMNEKEKSAKYTAKSLRELAYKYITDNKDLQQWVIKSAQLKNEDEYNDHIIRLPFTADEMLQHEKEGPLRGPATWGSAFLEGKIYCKQYGISILLVECRDPQFSDDHDLIHSHLVALQLITATENKDITDINQIKLDDKTIIIVNHKNHFVPVLLKTTVEKLQNEENKRKIERELIVKNVRRHDSHYGVGEDVLNTFIEKFRKLLKEIHDLPPSLINREPNKPIQRPNDHVPSDREIKIEHEICELIQTTFNKPADVVGEDTVENYVLNKDAVLKKVLDQYRETHLKILKLEKKVAQSLKNYSMSYLEFKEHLPEKLIALLPLVKKVLEDEQVKKEIEEYSKLNTFKNEASYRTLSAEDYFRNEQMNEKPQGDEDVPFQNPETLSDRRDEKSPSFK